MSRRHLDIPGSLRVDGRGPEHYTLAHIHIGARLEVTPSVVVSTSYYINKMSSIRCSGGCSPSAAVTRACGATWQTRRCTCQISTISIHLHICSIYTSTIYIYIFAQVHLPAICRDSIENFFASGAAEAGTEQPHVKVPVA